MDASIRAHDVDLQGVKKEPPHHRHSQDNTHQLNEKTLSGAQNSHSPWNFPEKMYLDNQRITEHKERLMDRERQRRHRERIRADPEKQQAYRDRERQRYQRRKSIVSAVLEEMPTDAQSQGLSGTDYHTELTGADRSHPINCAFLDVSQNSDPGGGNMAHMDNMVMKSLTSQADACDVREQIKEMNPVNCLLRVTEKETHEHLFSTQHRGAVFGSQDVNCYFVQQNGNLCSLMRLKKRLMDRDRQRRYRERIRSDPVKQSDDEKERRRVLDRERQRRRRERMRAESNKQQAHKERERQRLLDRERQRRCRQRLQADPVRWKAYLEKERCRSREAARRSRAKKSLAKALTGWMSEWGGTACETVA